jgi:hypothetical protein
VWSVIQITRSWIPSGGFPIATKAPKTTRVHEPPGSAPLAESVPRQVAPGSSTPGSCGRIVSACRTAGSSPALLSRSSSRWSPVGRIISPNELSIEVEPEATAKRTRESFCTCTDAVQPLSSTQSDSTRNTSEAPGLP